MIDDHLQQLNSFDPAVRRAAIIALGQSKDPAVLPALAAVYRTDPDPALREMALNAGRYVRQQGSNSAAGQPDAAGRAAPEPPVDEPPAEPKNVSARDKERARGYLDTAISQHTAGQRARAIDNLGKALSVDPELAKEPFVSNLIITITGLSTRDAVPMLTNARQRSAFIARAPGEDKSKRTEKRPDDDDTWPNVLVDLALYGLVSTLATLVSLVFAMPLIERLLKDMVAANAPGATLTFADIEAFTDASLAVLLPTAVGSAVYGVIGVIITGAAIHFAATTFLGGDGTLVGLYHKLVPLSTGFMILWALAFVLFASFGDFESLLTYSFLMFPATLVMYYVMSSVIGKVYRFSAFTGCLSIILGTVALAVFFGCGSYLFGGILGALLG
ncbi:HEAT repeat domain-containing protein [Aggregatilinea lenta]|uniref:HEAT repeat domain-containing protein n=1 Tax=Aggregatilinea lenta TaxID=913108 RepID=UPI000E5A5D76|nr:HEAT repeat domain-containing protein [Aggregatilinea lenta]